MTERLSERMRLIINKKLVPKIKLKRTNKTSFLLTLNRHPALIEKSLPVFRSNPFRIINAGLIRLITKRPFNHLSLSAKS